MASETKCLILMSLNWAECTIGGGMSGGLCFTEHAVRPTQKANQ
jgi:hypothetical protein